MNDDCFNCDKPECIGGKLGCAKKERENARRKERYQAKKKGKKHERTDNRRIKTSGETAT